MAKVERKLYEIGDDFKTLETLLDEIEGDVTDDAVAGIIEKWQAENQMNLELKLDGIGAIVKEYDHWVESRNFEAARLTALAKADSHKSKRIKEWVKGFLTSQSDQISLPIKTPRFNFNVQNNGGVVPVKLSEYAEKYPEELPEKYRRVVFQPNLDNMREDLLRLAELKAIGYNKLTADQQNEFNTLDSELGGFAILEPRGTHLRIR
jgi:hypothetical protein